LALVVWGNGSAGELIFAGARRVQRMKMIVELGDVERTTERLN
jgi:hypothetical protein